MFNAGGVRHEPAETLGRDHGHARRQRAIALMNAEGISADGNKRVWFDKCRGKMLKTKDT